MIRTACLLPVEVEPYISEEGMPMLGITENAQRSTAARFGFHSEQVMMQIEARRLAAPRLTWSNRREPTQVKDASWNLDNQHVYRRSPLRVLNVLNLTRLGGGFNTDLSNLHVAINEAFCNMGLAERNRFNVRLHTPSNLEDTDNAQINIHRIRALIENVVDDESRKLPWLILLPKHDYDLYANIKRVTDLRLGLHAVCAVGGNMHGYGLTAKAYNQLEYKPGRGGAGGRIAGSQYMANIGLKVNLKDKGVNHLILSTDLASVLNAKAAHSNSADPRKNSESCQTIIIGADVAHPTGGAIPGCPSIAGVVGSTDDYYVHYPGSMRLQLGRQESIAELDDMVKERLLDWAANHGGALPTSMLFYRDGVSESQYGAVRNEEVPQLQKAFELAHKVLHPGAPPTSPPFSLTLVVVGKRHNTRFYTMNDDNTYQGKDSRNAIVATRNVMPGTVVDTDITHPYQNDFYLQAHKAIKGTGRSAHYFVLKNQMRLTSDELQQVTHSLSYIYARATKGVSYCAPAYYADRLCDRGRAYMRLFLLNKPGAAVPRNQDEDFDAFKARVLRMITNSIYMRPRQNDPHPEQHSPNQYGSPRKNPWHPNLDGTMFYL